MPFGMSEGCLENRRAKPAVHTHRRRGIHGFVLPSAPQSVQKSLEELMDGSPEGEALLTVALQLGLMLR